MGAWVAASPVSLLVPWAVRPVHACGILVGLSWVPPSRLVDDS